VLPADIVSELLTRWSLLVSAVVSTCAAGVIGLTGSPSLAQSGAAVPQEIRNLPLLQLGTSGRRGEGKLTEVPRPKRSGVETSKLNLMPRFAQDQIPTNEDSNDEALPDIDKMTGEVSIEFYDVPTARTFRYEAPRKALAQLSRKLNPNLHENNGDSEPIPDEELKLESNYIKGWSQGRDNRSRRAIADGYSDQNIYQSIADFGGCTATVLRANSTRMIALTAAHCVFPSYLGDAISAEKLSPRRDGVVSPTWGTRRHRAVWVGHGEAKDF